MLINILFAILMLFAKTERVWCVSDADESTYIGYAYSLAGELSSEVIKTDFFNDLEGVPYNWYDTYAIASDARFDEEFAILRDDGQYDYLYIVSAESIPDIRFVYVMDHWLPGSDGQPHGCGAYIVNANELPVDQEIYYDRTTQ